MSARRPPLPGPTAGPELPPPAAAAPGDRPAGDRPAGDRPAGDRRAGDGPAGRAEVGTALRAAGGVVLAAASVQAAVVESFLVPLRIGRWPVPVCVVAAVVGNVVLARWMASVTGWRAAALAPPVLWLIVVLVFAAPRPEGDLIVPGSLMGGLFLFVGAIAGAFGAASVLMTNRRWPF